MALFKRRPAQKFIDWAVLHAQEPSIRLIACRKAWGSVRLQITACEHLTAEQRAGLLNLGFYKPRLARTDTLVRKDTQITLSQLRTVFPFATKESIPQEIAAHVAPLRANSRDDGDPAEVAAKLEEFTVLPLGLNHRGDQVFEGDEGRYYVDTEGRSVVESDLPSPDFLRATDASTLGLCADGFVREIASGKIMRGTDLVRFAAIVFAKDNESLFDVEKVIQSSPQMRAVQESVEAAMVRQLRSALPSDGEDFSQAFSVARSLMNCQPTFAARTSTSVTLQQYSTPLPMAVAAQMALGPTRGRTVLEPTVGHGALVSVLDGPRRVAGLDLDPKRLENLALGRPEIRASQGDATQMDFTVLNEGEKFDKIICNPPFGQLDKTIDWHGLKVRRLDQLVVLRALAARKDEGVGVFIVGADSYIDSKAGKISGSSRYFFNWLSDHFQVDVAEVPGRVYAKQGATYPVRLVVVGARGSEFDDVPDDVPLLDSEDAIYHWCERMRAKYGATLSAEEEVIQIPAEDGDEGVIAPSKPISEENSFQSPYPARSQVGEATAMVPRNLMTPLRQALDEVTEMYGGDIDTFVADELGWSVEEMSGYLSPEQVDAVALCLHQAKSTGGVRGVLSGDQTGLGKGRIMAAMARYFNLQGLPVTFLTETPTLFTDFWRDLRDINAHTAFNPMIMNAGVSIIDPVSGERLVNATPASVVGNVVQSGSFPEAYNLVLATYSQFNRDRNSATAGKSRWITTATSRGALLLDESHNAAGDSNTNRNISAAIDAASHVTYSSATAMKQAKNVGAYIRLFPSTVDIGSLPETLAAGGEVLQEVLSSMLARDGVFVRREHDLSNLKFSVVTDNVDRQGRNRDLSDHLAGVLEGFNMLAGDINKAVTERNRDIKKIIEKMPENERKGNRMGAVAVNFGSRLFNIYRQFLLALQVDLATDRALEALRSGKKPVLVLENTMEAILAEVVSANKEAPYEDEEELSAEHVAAVTSTGEVAIGDGITFRDVLHRMLGRLSYYNETGRYGDVTKVPLESEESREAIKRLRKLIDEMPDLPVSPIDSMRDRIQSAGFVCEELSGRKIGIETRDGNAFAAALEQRPKAEIVRRFNTGVTDALILTRAGSTGISLHASSTFPDQRQRRMIEVQSAADVNKRVQFFGRVNRKGQTSDPEIETLSTGLIGQARPIAMQNAKLRKLSANTTANQDNAALDATVPDFINAIGDEVAFRYLEGRPDIARRLDIEFLDDKEGQEETYYINKLTSRLVMLRVDEQEEIYAALTTEYVRLIAELDEKGINPLRSKEFDIRCKEIAREVYESGDPNSSSVFNHPVYLTTVEYEVDRHPLRSDVVKGYIEKHRENIKNAASGRTYPQIMKGIVRELEEARPLALQTALSSKHESVEVALLDKDGNAVKKTAERFRFLIDTLPRLDLGNELMFTGNEGCSVRGVVCGIGLPDNSRQMSALAAYTIAIAVPGEERLIERNLFGLREDAAFRMIPTFEDAIVRSGMVRDFDEAPAGKARVQRMLLDGNLFKAAQLAAQAKIGSSVVYTDAEGNRLRGVLLNKQVTTKDLTQLPVRVETPAMVEALLRGEKGLMLWSSNKASFSANEDVMLSLDGQTAILQCPGTMSRGGQIFGNKDLVAVVGEFAGGRQSMSVRFPVEKLTNAVSILYREGVSFYAQARMREIMNAMSKDIYKNESEVALCDEGRLTAVAR